MALRCAVDTASAQLAGLHEGQAGSQVGEHEIHLSADHVGQALRRAFIGHVQDVDIGAAGQRGAGHDAGVVAAGIGDAPGALARIGDQVGDRFPGPFGVGDQDEGQVAAARDGREVLHGVVGHVLHQPGRGRVRGVGGDEDRVAVGAGARHQIGGDGGVGAGLVLDDDLLAQDGREFVAENAPDRVGAGTGGKGTISVMGLAG